MLTNRNYCVFFLKARTQREAPASIQPLKKWPNSLNARSRWGLYVACTILTAATFMGALSPKGLGFQGHVWAKNDSLDEATRREKLHEIRIRQIPLQEEFLIKYEGSPRVAEMLLRLGEAYYETSKYYFAKENRAEGDKHLVKAIQTLEKRRKDFPKSDRHDEALFILANAYDEQKNTDKAGAILAELAETYPQSPVLGAAAMKLADFYFDKNEFDKAESFYQIASKERRTLSYVIYKLAWAQMNLGKSKEALTSFEKVIALRSEAEETGGDYSREAAREMVLVAFRVHGRVRILDYLKKTLQDGELVKLSLSTLAKAFFQRSDFESASDVYALLIENYTQDSERVEWLSTRLKAEENLGRATHLKDLVASLAGLEGGEKIADQVLNTAKKFHASAKKASTGPEKDRLFASAASYYETLLESVSVPTVRAEAYFYLAEILYDRNDFMASAKHYEEASAIEFPLQSRSLWNAFLSAEKAADGFRYQGKSPQTLSSSDQVYMRLAQKISESGLLTEAQKRRALYQSARLLYQRNLFDQALPLFQTLAEKSASFEEGQLSAHLVLDIYNLKKDYKQVASYARLYRQKGEGQKKSELAALEEQAELKALEIEDKRAKGLSGDEKLVALEASARAYLAFSSSYSQSRFVDAALWTSIQNFAFVIAERKSEDFTALKESFFLLTNKYSSSKFAPQAIALMGRFLAFRKLTPQDLQDYQRFYALWERQWQKEPKDQRGAMGMLVYRMAGRDAQKKKLAAEFAKLPKSPENQEALAVSQLWAIKSRRATLDAISLNNLKTLKAQTKKKMSLLETLYSDVTALVKLQVAEPAVEGLKILGGAYHEVAASMRSAPVPKQLEGDDLTKYRGIVDSAAADLESKGEEALKLAREKAQEFGLSGI